MTAAKEIAHLRDHAHANLKVAAAHAGGELERHAERMLTLLGEDITREGLRDTPARYTKVLQFLTAGSRTDMKDIVGDAVFEAPSSELVFMRNIEFYSLCEHHVLPFFGKAHIAYVPDGKVLGLAKLARIVDALARRLQIQERLTHQIAAEIDTALNPKGVAVFVEASHLCMMMRGVEKQNGTTLTKATLGAFATDAALRAEVLSLLNGAR
jgi:GTP cyclohydrolase I